MTVEKKSFKKLSDSIVSIWTVLLFDDSKKKSWKLIISKDWIPIGLYDLLILYVGIPSGNHSEIQHWLLKQDQSREFKINIMFFSFVIWDAQFSFQKKRFINGVAWKSKFGY